MKITKQEAVELIRQICPWEYTELPEREAKIIRTRVETEKLKPIDEGMSFHVWNVDYVIDGVRYQLIGNLGSRRPPVVLKMERWLVD